MAHFPRGTSQRLGSELNSPYMYKSLKAAVFPFSTVEDSVQEELGQMLNCPVDGLGEGRQEGISVLRVGS